jgi:hypothetical protein
VFYLYRSRVVSSKDSQRHDKGEDSSRHAGGDVADVEDSYSSSLVVDVISGSLKSCPGHDDPEI